MREIFPGLFVVLFLAFGGYFLFRALRLGGLKGAMFGAKIERSLGEVSAERHGPIGTVVKVHVLRRGADEKLVGLEFVAKSFASYQMMPVTLQLEQVQRLVALLRQASES